jgi:hypothetical protein
MDQGFLTGNMARLQEATKKHAEAMALMKAIAAKSREGQKANRPPEVATTQEQILKSIQTLESQKTH